MLRKTAARPRRFLLTLAAIVAAAMMVVGAALAAQPLYTDFSANRDQKELAREIKSERAKDAFQKSELAVGSPVTRIRIPKLGVDTVVVEGTSKEALDAGSGHYTESALPGQPGNVAIAGHRVTYGKPFNDLDKLGEGDRVFLDTPVGSYVYEMVPAFGGHANPWVIAPDDWSVIAPTAEPMLTLTTCHPKGSARQRLVARLKLVESPPAVSSA
jgi:sortase A